MIEIGDPWAGNGVSGVTITGTGEVTESTSNTNSVNQASRKVSSLKKTNLLKKGIVVEEGSNDSSIQHTNAQPHTPENTDYVIDGSFEEEMILDGSEDTPWTNNFEGNFPKNDFLGRPYYYFVEEDESTIPTGYWIGSYEGDPLISSGTITITNEAEKTGGLLITKKVTYNDNSTVPTDKQSLVNKTYTFSITKDGSEIADSPVSITVSNGSSNSQLLSGLEAGDYVISETDSQGLTLKTVEGGVSQDNTTKSITVRVSAGKTAEADLLSNAKATFTNNYTEYEVTIIKEDVTAHTIKLNGAVFDLFEESQVNANGTLKEDAIAKASGLTTTGTDDEEGKVSLGALTIGKYYLFETHAPDGYDQLTEPIEIFVNDGTVSLKQGTSLRTGTITQGKTELEVYNNPGVELPATGGFGTQMIYTLGGILTALAIVILYYKRQLLAR